MEVVRNIDSLFLEAYNHSAAHLTPTNNVFGLSIRRQTVNRGHYDDRQNGQVWRNVWDPCVNCYELIGMYGGEKANFDKKSDMPPMKVSEKNQMHSRHKETRRLSMKAGNKSAGKPSMGKSAEDMQPAATYGL